MYGDSTHHYARAAEMAAERARANRRLFLDWDGVFFDFDREFKRVFGHAPAEAPEDIHHSAPRFWERAKLKEGSMDFMQELYRFRPIILTGEPRDDWGLAHKLHFIYRSFLDTVPVTACPGNSKWTYCRPGDMLVDDDYSRRAGWEERGGRFCHFESFPQALVQIRQWVFQPTGGSK